MQSTPSCTASRPRASRSYSGTRAAPTCPPTTRSSTRASSHVLVRHEAGGGHAAEGYAKASGKVGVCFATSGPGATNIVTPLTDAMMDSVPVVFFTGQVRTDLLGHGRLPGGGHVRHHHADRQALLHDPAPDGDPAGGPRGLPHRPHRPPGPGPDRPPDGPHPRRRSTTSRSPTCACPATSRPPRATRSRSGWPPRRSPTPAARSSTPAAASIDAEASEQLIALVTADRFPITCTLMGLGAFPAPHPQWLGMLGMHGTRAANYAMDEADLILAAGARFDDRITGKLSRVRAAGEVHPHRHRPGRDLQERPGPHPDRRRREEHPRPPGRGVRGAWTPSRRGSASWWERIERWRSQHPLRYDDSPDTEIKPQRADRGALRGHGRRRDLSLRRRPAPDVVAQYFHFREPRTWINSGGLGTMGFGLPAALGAQMARPDDLVVLRLRRRLDPDEHPGAGDDPRERPAGEGRACINNGYLGMVRQWQELFWDRRYSPSTPASGRTSSSSPRPTASPATACRTRRRSWTTCASIMQRRRPRLHRRARHQGGEHVSDDRPRRRRPGHGGLRHGRSRDQGRAADAGGPRGHRGLPHRPQAHPLDPRGEQAGRAHARRRPVRPPRLQHRHARRRPDRRPDAVAHHPDRSTGRCTRSTR